MKSWLKIIFVILTFALISVVVYFILKAFGLTDINQIKALILSTKQFGMVVYSLILTILITLLCFVPLLDTGLIVLGLFLFGPIKTFICCMISIFLSTTALFFIGDKLGEKFAKKLIGEKELEKVQNLVDVKSKILLPILFFIPGVPDEAVCLVAGMTKMKYWYILIVSLIFHLIEIGLLCFIGSGVINWSTLSIIDWFVFINMIVLDFILLLKLEKNIKNNKK